MASVKKMEKIWLDGEMINWDDAKVHILTHTLHYGLGVFEGIRCYKCADGRPAVYRLKDHIDRLYASAHINLMEITTPKTDVMQACRDIFTVNKLEEGYLRPIAFYGDGEMGLYASNKVRVSVIAWPWGSYLGDEGVKNGIRVKISSFNRLHANVNLPKSKTCGNYVNSILAKREAVLAGYEEALLLDTDSYIAEATGENIFVVKDGTVFTPPEGSSILPGLTRHSVMTLLKDVGIPVVEARISRDTAYVADEIFLTGTAAEITPVRELDNRKIGTGKPGPITQKVQAMYFDLVRGKNERHADWLDYIG